MTNRPISNRFARAAVSLAVLLLVGACGEKPGPRRQRTNDLDYTVLVTIDTLRADHLPFHGYAVNTAPFLGRLAEQSALFLNCASASSHTGPSHATMLTGRYPSQHGLVANGVNLDEDVPTLARLARQDGVRTGAFAGVAFLETLLSRFDEYDPLDTSHFAPGAWSEGGYRQAGDTVEKACDWVEGLRPDQPFFLWVHLYDLHEWKRAPDQPWLERIDRAFAEAGQGPGDRRQYLAALHGLLFFRKDRAIIHRCVSAARSYDARILAVDDAIGALYDAVTSRFAGRKGLWVVTSDHGEGLGSHGYFGHGMYLYEEQLRVPLLLHFTDRRFAGVKVEELVRTIDLFPTLNQAFGWKVDWPLPSMGHPSLEPRSLLPLLARDREAEPARLSFAERRQVREEHVRAGWEPGEVRSLRGQRFKYIGHSGGVAEYYDLSEDPLELSSLVNRSPPDLDLLAEILRAQIRVMEEQTRGRVPAEIDPAHLDELRQLGYTR